MTTAPHWVDGDYPPSALAHKPRTIDKYTAEAPGTFGLVLTLGGGLCRGPQLAAVGIGVVLMALIYAGGLRSGAHCNPAITLAAAMWGRISYSEAAGYWLGRLAGRVRGGSTN